MLTTVSRREGKIVRSTFATVGLISMLLLGATASKAADLPPDALLQRGIENYRSAKYQDAATDLNAAAQAILSPDQMQKYVDTGKFENLAALETALVYLALAESRLGHESAAHDAVVRLITAERIEPLYAQLPLEADAVEFEALAKRIAPGTPLPPNTALASGGAPSGAAEQVAQTTVPAPSPAAPPSTPTSEPAPAATQTAAAAPVEPSVASQPSTPPATAPQAATQTSTSESTAAREREREQYIEQRLAEERAKLEKMFEERLTAERAALQKEAAVQIAAAQKNAQEQIEAAQKNAQQQVAAARREAEQQIAATRERRDHLATVREGDAAAIQGNLDSARRLYAVVANAPDAPRELLADAALGLYRTGGYRDAVRAFRRLTPFAKGEEDLRFYNAISLYETGNYTDAKKELSCSLPYLERGDEVERYRTKIESAGIQ